MKRFIFPIFIIIAIAFPAIAAGPGTTPLTNTILLNSPTANTTLDSILSQQGSTPLLDNIVNQANGTYVRTLPATQTNAQTIQGLSPNASWQLAGNILTATGFAISKYQPVLGSAAICLGYLANYEFDLKKAYDNSWLQSDSGLNGVITDLFPTSTSWGYVAANGYTGPNGIVIQGTNSIWYRLNFGASNTLAFGTYYNFPVASIPSYCGTIYFSLSYGAYTIFTATKLPGVVLISDGTIVREANASLIPFAAGNINTAPATGPPAVLPTTSIQTLAQKLVQAMANNPAIKTALINQTAQHPELMNQPYPISKQDVANYKKNNIQNAYNTASTTINNISNANPTDTAAATASATASATATANENQETFDQVPAEAFKTPYSKDQVSFTDRLNTFFTNVKSSPLFSFSQGFFNSIPGGGSPVFHVSAGTYGEHVYDMSETMTAGLAVMKACFLCVFSFLSIRAVIMKR